MDTSAPTLDDYLEGLDHLAHSFDEAAAEADTLDDEERLYHQAATIRAARRRAKLLKDDLLAESFYDTALGILKKHHEARRTR